jgi:hypothetical protein
MSSDMRSPAVSGGALPISWPIWWRLGVVQGENCPRRRSSCSEPARQGLIS